MFKRRSYVFLSLPLLIVAGSASAISDAQYQSILALGDLNGVALHCGYHAETRRIKGTLIRTLPKRRQLGEVYEEATNKSYLKFIDEKQRCPEEVDFVKQVDQAIEHLQTLFQK